jgi:hydroxyacylglutathione hydrolase
MEILPGLHRIDGVNGNCYVLERDGLVLVDTGLPRSGKKIISYIRNTLGRGPGELKVIVLTHYHIDHTGSVADLRKMTGAAVAIHEADAEYLAGKSAMPFPHGFFGLILRLFGIFWPFQPIQPDILLHDEDVISGLRCIHTPGHTPGSICLDDPVTGVVFSGDAILARNGAIRGPSGLATTDPASAVRSIKKMARIEFDILLPGHGDPVRPGAGAALAEFSRTLL